MTSGKDISHGSHAMTEGTIQDFVSYQRGMGASANALRRDSCALRMLYDFLDESKLLTEESLASWRRAMEDKGYAPITIHNHAKSINRYLNHVGCPQIRFQQEKGRDIRGMTFGYLTALESTEKRERKNIIWRCQCKCGKELELPATRLLVGNTLSCGCRVREHLQQVNQYIENTSIRQSLEEKVKSANAASGYTGVTAKNGKWQAYITYKGQRYSLGVYENIEDAVRARARGKELVREDALQLLEQYKNAQRT